MLEAGVACASQAGVVCWTRQRFVPMLVIEGDGRSVYGAIFLGFVCLMEAFSDPKTLSSHRAFQLPVDMPGPGVDRSLGQGSRR